MGASSTKLTPVEETLVGDSPLLASPPAAPDGKVVLRLREQAADTTVQSLFGADTTTLNASYEDAAGQLIITQLRNHMPHNTVAPEYAGNLPFTGAVPAQALVHFLDADGKTVAVLLNGSNDRGVSGVHVSAEHSFTHAAADGYRNGEGASVLYAAKTGRGDQFFDDIPTQTAAACGLAGSPCAICMATLEPDEPLKVLPCNSLHAFHPACINEWLAKNATCPVCRQTSALTGGVVARNGTLIHGGDVLHPVAQIKCVLSEKQRCARGIDYRYKGGVGLYPIGPDGTVANKCALSFDGGACKRGKTKVAKLVPWFYDLPASKKVQLAPGVDPVLVLALASEFDANQKGVATAPIEGALAG